MTDDPKSNVITETAARMLARYRSVDVAAEMAWHHAMDYQPGHDFRLYWDTVRKEIRRQARERGLLGHQKG